MIMTHFNLKSVSVAYLCMSIDETLERFGNKRTTTEQCALPELSIEIGAGSIMIGDVGQPNTLVPLAVV